MLVGLYGEAMRITVFTEGTIIMHRTAVGRTREEIVNQVREEGESVHDFATYVPVGNAPDKLRTWQNQGAEILYLTSRTRADEIESVREVLKRHGFPDGRLLFREGNEQYRDVAERVVLNILVEDDCESIGGADQMTITQIRPGIRKRIRSIPVKEFGGIDYLPDKVSALIEG